jgi:hypothetical protein
MRMHTATMHQPRRRIPRALARSLWLVVLLVHAPALLSGWATLLGDGGGLARLGGFVALNVSALFFILKICEVRLLEIRCDARSLAVFGVAIVLLHVHLGPGAALAAQLPQQTPLAAGVLVMLTLTPVQRMLESWLSAAPARRSRPARVLLAGTPVADQPRWAQVPELATPRPPPTH